MFLAEEEQKGKFFFWCKEIENWELRAVEREREERERGVSKVKKHKMTSLAVKRVDGDHW